MAIVEPVYLRDSTEDNGNRLALLETELRGLSVTDPINELACTARQHVLTKVTELFRLATLTYLVRASESQCNKSAKADKWVQNAFSILSQLDACRWRFILLIFGFEARSDDQRTIILELIARTKKTARSHGLELVSEMIRSLWVQDDLVNEELVYLDRFGIIMSVSPIIPLFV